MKEIDIRTIVIPYDIRNSKPSERKLNAVRKYYEENKTIDKPIVISKDNILIDNYVRYLVALENNMIKVPYIITQGNKAIDNSTMTLVVGKFPNNDKEYTWRVPFNKTMDIKIGDRVVVNVKWQGRRCKRTVNVINVYQSNDYQLIRHRCVVRVIKNKSESN